MRRHTGRLLFAMALIPQDAPLAQRIEILGKYLTPSPRQPIEIEDTQARDDAAVAKDPGKLYGLIRVSPPKGTCFTITTDPRKPDVTVCKPASLRWALEDLDFERTSITWTIKTGPGDFGTPVTWTAPYTIAKTMPFTSDFYKYNSTPVFFKSCVPTPGKSDGTLRKITLTQFNNKKWYIRFPDKDGPITPPPAPPKPIVDPELEKKKGKGKKGGHGEEGGHGEPPPEDGHGEKKADDGHGDTKADDGHGGKKEEKPAKEEPWVEPEQWTINTRRGHEMSVENFVSEGSMPPGKKGTCRYVYDYIPGDTSLGRIECHHTDVFLYFYAFLRCLGPIIPK